MAGRFVSVPTTLSDLERPDVRNQFCQADLITLVRSARSLHLHKCVHKCIARFVSDSWVFCSQCGKFQSSCTLLFMSSQ